jgi:hypothetical protein
VAYILSFTTNVKLDVKTRSYISIFSICILTNARNSKNHSAATYDAMGRVTMIDGQVSLEKLAPCRLCPTCVSEPWNFDGCNRNHFHKVAYSNPTDKGLFNILVHYISRLFNLPQHISNSKFPACDRRRVEASNTRV